MQKQERMFVMAVLIVEDEADIRELLALQLRRSGMAVETAASGDEAYRLLETTRFDLILLDWMMPGMSGIELSRAIRTGDLLVKNRATPILMLTARGEPNDIILGLEMGADDYVVKPFESAVLMARVRALLRRKDLAAEPVGSPNPGSSNTLGSEPSGRARRHLKVVEMGDLQVWPQAHEVKAGGQSVSLTPSEFKLLLALMENRGKVLTREQLIALVQGEGIAVVDRAIDTHVFGLRKKLGTSSDWIETVRGVGYRVRLEP